MTDDLFDDFDLKPVMQNAEKKEEEPIRRDLTENIQENPSEISSENLHPDIFSAESIENDGQMTEDEMRCLSEQIEAEKTPFEKAFSFRDSEKLPPFESDTVYTTSPVMEEVRHIEVRRIDKIRRPDNVLIDPENYGDTLRKLRESACISIAELAAELRIKESFLVALEREDYDNLPPEVFVVAYIRRLGGIYHLTETEILSLSRKVKARMEVELPEDMDKVVTIYEPSKENENKIRHIFTAFGIILAVTVILILTGIYFFVSGRRSNTDLPVQHKKVQAHFSPETLIKLQPEVKLDTPALKITR